MEYKVAPRTVTVLQQYEQAALPLLQHFWACFHPKPPSQPSVIAKAEKMGSVLTSFNVDKLEKLVPTLSHDGARLFANLQVSLCLDQLAAV